MQNILGLFQVGQFHFSLGKRAERPFSAGVLFCLCSSFQWSFRKTSISYLHAACWLAYMWFCSGHATSPVLHASKSVVKMIVFFCCLFVGFLLVFFSLGALAFSTWQPWQRNMVNCGVSSWLYFPSLSRIKFTWPLSATPLKSSHVCIWRSCLASPDSSNMVGRCLLILFLQQHHLMEK